MSCGFSACCIASGEPAQIRDSISKMKMEIQKKIWTSKSGPGPPKISSYMGFYEE